jgi:hypothetical protein
LIDVEAHVACFVAEENSSRMILVLYASHIAEHAIRKNDLGILILEAW